MPALAGECAERAVLLKRLSFSYRGSIFPKREYCRIRRFAAPAAKSLYAGQTACPGHGRAFAGTAYAGPTVDIARSGKLIKMASRASRLAGFTRWCVNPAANARRRSSSCPNPVRATSTVAESSGCANAAGHLVAIHVGHRDIEKNRVRMLLDGELQCQGAVARDDRILSHGIEHHGKCVGRGLGVVHDQQSMARQGMNLRQLSPTFPAGNRLEARQRDDEFAPAPRTLTIGLNRPAMQLDQLSGQRETDAKSALRAASACHPPAGTFRRCESACRPGCRAHCRAR